MVKLKRFEDLNAWQHARILVRLVYQVTSSDAFSPDRDLVRQIRRAAVSVMSNIAEGFSRYTFKDSKQFYVTARGSLAELRSQLHVASDLKYLGEVNGQAVQTQLEVTGKLLSGLIRNSQRRLEIVTTDRTIEQMSH